VSELERYEQWLIDQACDEHDPEDEPSDGVEWGED